MGKARNERICLHTEPGNTLYATESVLIGDKRQCKRVGLGKTTTGLLLRSGYDHPVKGQI